MTAEQRAALTTLMNASGLRIGTLPEPFRQSLLDSAQAATQALRLTLGQPEQPTTRV
ncbi:hypothetical protein [Streptoalloteichus hindustanus]|uniref:Uncharacterized protein n=1 Tax=Streptoalloteichus hindustanus TaxID=2017 RepID=A0A1M5DPI3_STRHI|nr:hypothetical protein [Streptoalloteichus hindustanus]SHF68781.1 hypothetical protein SAMN05444320_104545 [Streptoalloteichus hindustanus]